MVKKVAKETFRQHLIPPITRGNKMCVRLYLSYQRLGMIDDGLLYKEGDSYAIRLLCVEGGYLESGDRIGVKLPERIDFTPVIISLPAKEQL